MIGAHTLEMSVQGSKSANGAEDCVLLQTEIYLWSTLGGDSFNKALSAPHGPAKQELALFVEGIKKSFVST